MAGDWLKFEINTPEKPEVLSITVDMGWDDPDLTVGKLLRLWRWFDQHTEDGNATNVTEALLDRIVGVTGFCKAMANVGWLFIDESGITLPNFDRHNGKTAKNRSLTAKRVANHKSNAKGNAEGNANTVTEALPREEKRREEKILKDKTTPPNPQGGMKLVSKEPTAKPKELEMPDWLNADTWDMWDRFRKSKTAKGWTLDAKKLSLKTLEKLQKEGHSPAAVIEQSIERGWTGLFEVKVQAGGRPSAHTGFAKQDYHKGVAADGTF